MRIDWQTLAKSSIKEKRVTQRTLVKCGRKMIPMIGQRTKLSRSRQLPNVAKNKNAPHSRTLSHCGLQPTVARNVPLIRGLCHAADFDQMWPKMCPLLEDFVTQWTSTKCGPKCAPRLRTLSLSGLQPNVVQTCAFRQVTLFCYGVRPHMDRQRTHHQKRPVPSKWILIVDQCRTKTAVSDYNAMWSIC